ncbi:unnamed protein product, partial [Staurois parvus]
MRERGQRMLKRTVHRSCQLSAESIAKELQASFGLQRASWNVFPWPGSCIQALQSVGCSGAKHAPTGLW